MKPLAAALLIAALASCAQPPPPVTPPSAYAPSLSTGGAPRSSAASTPARATPARGGMLEYAGRGDGGRILVRLTSLADGRTRAEGSVQGQGGPMCMGVFVGNGSFQGSTLRVQEENLPGCVVTLTRSGRSLTVDAGAPACLGLSGPSCSLSGTLAQR